MASEQEIEAAQWAYIKTANTNVGLREAISAALKAAEQVRAAETEVPAAVLKVDCVMNKDRDLLRDK
jgi:hypothetical protein